MGLGNNRPTTTNVPTVTPEQEQLISQFAQSVSGLLPQGLDAILNQLDPQRSAQFFEQNIATPQREQFLKTTIPGIQQAGANLGAKGGSTIERQLAQAGRGLETDLSRQLAQFQQQGMQSGLQSILGFTSPALRQPFQPVFQPGAPGFGQQAGAGLLQALPFILASL